MSARQSAEQAAAPCVHCGVAVRLVGTYWMHVSGLARCQSAGVPYGHLAHPADVPCEADGPNPCLGASDADLCECDRPDMADDPHRHNFDVACVYWLAGRPTRERIVAAIERRLPLTGTEVDRANQGGK